VQHVSSIEQWFEGLSPHHNFALEIRKVQDIPQVPIMTLGDLKQKLRENFPPEVLVAILEVQDEKKRTILQNGFESLLKLASDDVEEEKNPMQSFFEFLISLLNENEPLWSSTQYYKLLELSIDLELVKRYLISEPVVRRLVRYYMVKEQRNFEDLWDQKDIISLLCATLKVENFHHHHMNRPANPFYDNDFFKHIIHGSPSRGPHNPEKAAEICALTSTSVPRGAMFAFRTILADFESNKVAKYIIDPMKRILDLNVGGPERHYRTWIGLHIGKHGLLYLVREYLHKLPTEFLTQIFVYLLDHVNSNAVVASYCWTFVDVREKIKDAIVTIVNRIQAELKENPKNPAELIQRKESMESVLREFEDIWGARKPVVIDDSPWKHGFNPSNWGPDSLESN